MTPEDSLWLIIWESVATIGIIAVIFGIIGEGSELLAKWAIKRKYKKFQNGLDDGSRWFLAILMKFVRPRLLEVETFAFALVILGLVAEFWGGHKSQQILDRNNSRLNLQSEQLRSENNDTKAQLDASMKSTKDALEKLDASMKLKIELEQAYFPRIFRPDAQLTNFAGVKFSTAFRLNRDSQNNDVPEAQDLYGALFIGLVNSGWVWNRSDANADNGEAVGVIVCARPGTPSSHDKFAPTPESMRALNAAKTLVAELRTNQIMVSFVMVGNGPPSDAVEIIVGRKPNLKENREQSFRFNDSAE